MGKKILLIAILICLTFTLKAEGYRISLQWEGLKDTLVYLAHYFDTKIYVNDTTKLDKDGKGIFTGDKKLHEGLYVLYLSEKVYFDVLIGSDQEFSISANNSDIIKTIKIENSKESENFLVYQNILREKSNEKNDLIKQSQQPEKLERQKVQENQKISV
jgi:hypothetical protein